MAQRLPAGNVMTIDTEHSLSLNRMETKRDHFLGCKELPLLKNEDNLINEAADNGVSDIIDMTGGSLLKDNTDIAEELASVNFVRPHL